MSRQHGTYVSYVADRCRCDACKAANREYERARARRLEPPYVAAGPAREHVRELMEAGVGLKQIAKAATVAHGTLWKLVYGMPGRGPSKRVRKATLDALLAVTPAAAADGARVDAGPTWALVDEMVDAGIPKLRIARSIGQRVGGLQLGQTKVEAATARKIADLHAAWLAGTVDLRRRDGRHAPGGTSTPPARPRRDTSDVLDLFEQMAEIVEERNARTWRNDAACRNRPTWLWFPAPGDHKTADHALRICRACMVRDQCRGELVDDLRVGIVGGLTVQRRRQLRAEGEGPRRRAVAECGTNSGYTRHRRADEAACDACKLAHAHYKADRERVPA